MTAEMSASSVFSSLAAPCQNTSTPRNPVYLNCIKQGSSCTGSATPSTASVGLPESHSSCCAVSQCYKVHLYNSETSLALCVCPSEMKEGGGPTTRINFSITKRTGQDRIL